MDKQKKDEEEMIRLALEGSGRGEEKNKCLCSVCKKPLPEGKKDGICPACRQVIDRTSQKGGLGRIKNFDAELPEDPIDKEGEKIGNKEARRHLKKAEKNINELTNPDNYKPGRR